MLPLGILWTASELRRRTSIVGILDGGGVAPDLLTTKAWITVGYVPIDRVLRDRHGFGALDCLRIWTRKGEDRYSNPRGD